MCAHIHVYIDRYVYIIHVCENPCLNVGFRIEQKQDILAMSYPLKIHINNLNFIRGKFRGQI